MTPAMFDPTDQRWFVTDEQYAKFNALIEREPEHKPRLAALPEQPTQPTNPITKEHYHG